MFFEIPLELSEIAKVRLPDIQSAKLSELGYMLSIRVLDEDVILVGCIM